MDKPQFQVPQSGPGYRFMGYPPQRQPLQLLYPGRMMEQWYHFTGDNIPNEDPDGAFATQEQLGALSKAADMETEAMAKYLGGKEKVLRHPAVAPEAILEDPALRGTTLESTPPPVINLQSTSPDGTSSQGMSSQGEGSSTSSSFDLTDLKQSDDQAQAIINRVRQGEMAHHQTGLFPEDATKLANYAWKSTGAPPPREYFSSESYEEGSPSPITDEHLLSTHRDIAWAAIIVLIILAVVILALLGYGVYKHHRNTEALRPKVYHVVN